MTRIQFGVCLPIFASPGARLFRTPSYASLDAATTMDFGRVAESLGYDSLWVADHLMLGKDEAILEGWTTLAALAGMTQRARLGVIHYNNAFRHPALTAKMVATLDQISGGRMIHFLDYGNQPREFLAYGLHRDDNTEDRIAQMREGLELTVQLWTAAEPLFFDGKHYQVAGAVCEPKPLQKPHPPIWLGEAFPGMLEATARYAHGWNTTPVTIPELRRRLGLLREACARAERNFADIEISVELQVLIAPDHDILRQKLRAMIDLIPAGQSPDAALLAFVAGSTDRLPEFMADGWLAGTPERVIERVQAYVDEGVSHFMLWFVDAPDQSGMRLFAETVAPRFG
jgi:alkanesulfonate monooxygenase SsuD/methylene tetrahydromethanopterin reductase-like flavin-dependent oxidoreductase (luciferase family)